MQKPFYILFFLIFASYSSAQVHYLPLGDSYTICRGVETQDCWVAMLTDNLNQKGLRVELLSNPAKNGYTTNDLIANELPLLNTYPKIELVTLLIGANDWVQGTDTATYHKKLAQIIDKIQFKVSKKTGIILITIPDFSATPDGKSYSHGKSITKGLTEYNDIIKAEAKSRNLILADIFQISQQMEGKKELVSSDGLHPSANEYRLWLNVIEPLVEKGLKSK